MRKRQEEEDDELQLRAFMSSSCEVLYRIKRACLSSQTKFDLFFSQQLQRTPVPTQVPTRSLLLQLQYRSQA